MKFAIISDIHFGEEGEHKGVIRKMSRFALPLLKQFIERMNNEVKPEFVVNLGDAINDIDHSTDVKNLEFTKQIFKELNCPVYNVAGNHEQRTIELEELEKIYNRKPIYHSFDHQGYHFIVLFSDDYGRRGPVVSDEQIAWLQNDLSQSDMDCVVFVHHALADQDLTGNFWFDGVPERCLIKNREQVREVLESSRKVRAVFNGHLHWNNMTVHNHIPYINIQSLVENFKNEDVPSGSYAVVEVNQEFIDVDIRGNDNKRYSYNRNAS